MDGNNPPDYIDWRIKLMREELDKEKSKKNTFRIPPNNPWGIDPMLFPDGVTKEKYDKLVEGVVRRDKKKMQDDDEVDAFLKKNSKPTNNDILFGNLDKIDMQLRRQEQLDEKQLHKDLEEVYVSYKGQIMRNMIDYINYDVFIRCYNYDMNKVEKCLYELKNYLQTKDRLTENENIFLFTINNIIFNI